MITIGIPVFNQQEYLADAIESALDQTVKAEVIVCNDGSTDHSLEVAKSYEKHGVKVINQVNKGLASARNTLIMNMKGDYFLPLDADDILLEQCVERIEQSISQNHSDVIAPSFKSFGVSNDEVILRVIPTMEDFIKGNRLAYFSAIKKEVLLEVGGYNPKMTWGWEDYDLWIDIFKRNHTLTLLQEVLVLYRTKERSMIHVANEHSNELFGQMIKNHPQVYDSIKS